MRITLPNLKNKETYFRLINLLENLKMETMFFEPHLPNDPQMVGAYKNCNCDEFVEFVKKHSNLNHSKFIGKAEYERPIYLLYK